MGGKMDSVRDKASDKDKERVMKNINIMWNALSKNRLFDGNKELKEFIMTLTGTLIFGRTVKSRRCRHAPLTRSD
uniref:Conjugative relaxosome accessory transposon protein n=1 Tax=Klebsiella pneumoniae TaxID=573 RepID=A0A2P1BPW6_KLEPN|nr:Conjugative relaxosome accessory transposon protein [Klebsiella pneumoniae]